MPDFITRFAPSPTGRLHLGHAYSAMLVRKAADEAGGKALLRIEDIDMARCRPEYETAIHDDLSWLGLEWDGDVRRQSDHLAEYARVVDELRGRDLLYRCFRSRAKINELMGDTPGEAFTSEPLTKDEEHAKLDADEPYAWRLSLERAADALGPSYAELAFTVEDGDQTIAIPAEPQRFGDIALTRKDAPVAYHLAACHDDAAQGITHIIRGMDLVHAPHIQIVLQALMDWPRPIYRHHHLLTGPDGKRLAKRDKSKTLQAMRADGLTPEDITRQAGLA